MKVFEQFNIDKNEDALTLKITKDSPRSRMGFKVIVNYRFRTIDQLNDYFVKWYNAQERAFETKNAQKETVKEARKNFVNPFKVGQIFYDSWGYDQTNIDFYQIVSIGRMTVEIRPISQVMTRAAGYLCEYVRPDADNFTGEASQKRIVLDRNAKPHINGYRGWLSVWDREEIYQSHYA